ncbi:MAG TPA: hypothetical protein VID68_13490 [Solirubrobacteraceae bacterium]|jgi:hypothetical protein
MRPSRSLPQIGAPARVWHFSGEAEPVTIVELREAGRCVVVTGADGTRREFTLRRANAFFIERGSQHSPRLEF